MIGTVQRSISATAWGTGVPRIAALSGALAAVVAVRVALNGTSPETAFAAGLIFGTASILIAVRAGLRVGVPRLAALGAGVIGGVILAGLPGWVHPYPAPGLGLHPEPFLVWALITVIVAIGEEAILRGVLFDSVASVLGRGGAVLFTSVAFALIHVPLYGWHVVPLDLGVGLWLAGMRLVTGGIAASATAHALADLATWWL